MTQGCLKKLQSQLADPVQYGLALSDTVIPLNPFLGQKIKLTFTGAIYCVACQRKINKSFNQGYCFPCFQNLAQCDMCIVKPELCHFDKGTCREPNWGMQHCMQEHIVYLANTSGLKVGITRHSQIPTRWIDQGATQAIPIIAASSRFVSGLIEVELGQYVADKTNWRQLLKSEPDSLDMVAQKNELLAQAKMGLEAISQQLSNDKSFMFIDNPRVQGIQYPVLTYPTKIASFNFDKHPEVAGTLQGIKGQYLIFDTGVINIRKFGGYEIQFEVL